MVASPARSVVSRGNALGRIRTCNLLIRSQRSVIDNRLSTKGLRLATEPLGLPLAYGPETDPDLAALVDAWPSLPDAVKAGILAMVKACR